jgi:phage terminase small subunit
MHRFIHEYLIDLDPAAAARRAGYSLHTAKGIGLRLLRDPAVAAAVKEAQAMRADRLDITAERVLREYARIAFADIRRLLHWGPAGVALRPDYTLTDDDAAAIAELSLTVAHGDARPRIKLHDKRGALNSIARHLGLFARESGAAAPAPAAPGRSAREILFERLDRLRVKESDTEGGEAWRPAAAHHEPSED